MISTRLLAIWKELVYFKGRYQGRGQPLLDKIICADQASSILNENFGLGCPHVSRKRFIVSMQILSLNV